MYHDSSWWGKAVGAGEEIE
jgi:hypothetical protein